MGKEITSENILDDKKRRRIYYFISHNEGVLESQLFERISTCYGIPKYSVINHLHRLWHFGLIGQEGEGELTRFYTSEAGYEKIRDN